MKYTKESAPGVVFISGGAYYIVTRVDSNGIFWLNNYRKDEKCINPNTAEWSHSPLPALNNLLENGTWKLYIPPITSPIELSFQIY